MWALIAGAGDDRYTGSRTPLALGALAPGRRRWARAYSMATTGQGALGPFWWPIAHQNAHPSHVTHPGVAERGNRARASSRYPLGVASSLTPVTPSWESG